MSTEHATALEGAARPSRTDPADRALPCVDLALDYAPDTLLIDFDAWCAARDCTTATLRRHVDA